MPNVIDRSLIVIPGVQKSGTSTLAQMITDHAYGSPPCTSDGQGIKETNFFALDSALVSKHLDFYASLFPAEETERNGNRFFVDASPSYFMAPEAPELIERYVRDVRYVVIVRDPVQRAHSSYLHMRGKVDAPELRSFEQIIESIFTSSEADIVAAENAAVERAAQNGDIDPEYIQRGGLSSHLQPNFSLRYQSPLAPFKYIQHSMYSRWLPNYETENRSPVIVSLEQLADHPGRTINAVFRDLGLPAQESVDPVHKNRTKVPNQKGKVVFGVSKFLRKISVFNRVLSADWMTPLKSTVKSFLFTDRSHSRDASNPRALEGLYELLDEEYAYWGERNPSIADRWTSSHKHTSGS
jgi:hypothetical protein